MAEKRTKVEHKFEPAVGEDTPPERFDLVRLTEYQTRRSNREMWRADTDRGRPPRKRETLATFTRRQLASLLADGADWLAYIKDE